MQVNAMLGDGKTWKPLFDVEKMKTFISHSSKDKEFVLKLADSLKANGIEVWYDEYSINLGDNILEKIQDGLESSSAIIPVLSGNYIESKWAMQELSFASARALNKKSIRIVPVLIEDCDIPIFLRDRLYADFRQGFDRPFESVLRSLLEDAPQEKFDAPERSIRVEHGKKKSLAYHARKLSKHLQDGELTLVCGAGVSVEAGAPTWQFLLNELLSNLIKRQLPDAPSSVKDQKKLADLYQEYFSPTSLVVAQYLKNGLGDDFLPMVRKTLYSNSTSESDLLRAIVDLCRPQRSRESLQAIINFNFDDLIEANLRKQYISHCLELPR